jgi:hypothetical protein
MFVRRYWAVGANPTMKAPITTNDLTNALYPLVTIKDLCQ